MTMLDRMRRHRNWLKWSLLLVCLAFVIFYIPDFLRGTGADAASTERIATIEGRDITAGEFRRIYEAQLQAYRSAYGGQMNDQLLKQLGVEQQILQQMVDERAALAEADRLAIRVSARSPEEIRNVKNHECQADEEQTPLEPVPVPAHPIEHGHGMVLESLIVCDEVTAWQAVTGFGV